MPLIIGPSLWTMHEPGNLHRVAANGIDFAYYEMGSGPLALCLHGYPDTAATWRHLMPELAGAGFRAVAPFNRGYAPTGLDPNRAYHGGAVGLDANALHETLGGDGDAVLIGHDWGALGTYAAAGLEPERWRRLVAMAVPPGPVAAQGYFAYDQLRRSWYMFFQLTPLAEGVIPMNDFEFIKRLWNDWSPGHGCDDDVAGFAASMATPDNLAAALEYYKQTLLSPDQSPELNAAREMALAVPPQPTLYMHGTDDGCMGAEFFDGTREVLPDGESETILVEGTGHFLHLEDPVTVNAHILDFLR